jgi:glycosyltransferase involved in cell wall biosynthesis
VYNRPQEIKELLGSFLALNFNESFEIVIVEDGSSESSEEIVKEFFEKLSISYYYKPNTGPGDSRNYGMQKANGNYYIILDSDCLVPPHYLETVDKFLEHTYVDCYGGADAAHVNFTALQKAINYTMTSFLTTGGIRGSKKSVNKFEPRSFNMGISAKAFKETGGFSKIHPGEDPDLSQRIEKLGFKTVFIPDAYVYHKRRISWSKFYTQVKKFGMVRPILNKWHPDAAKITFWFPSLFICFVLLSVLLGVFVSPWFLLPLCSYLALLFVDANFRYKNTVIACMVIWAVFIQFFGYGFAFLKSTFYISVLGRDPEKQFPKLFFK